MNQKNIKAISVIILLSLLSCNKSHYTKTVDQICQCAKLVEGTNSTNQALIREMVQTKDSLISLLDFIETEESQNLDNKLMRRECEQKFQQAYSNYYSLYSPQAEQNRIDDSIRVADSTAAYREIMLYEEAYQNRTLIEERMKQRFEDSIRKADSTAAANSVSYY